jgi:hypothetical protein
LLHEQVQQLRWEMQSGITVEHASQICALIVDAFLLLVECAKDAQVELTFVSKLFRQLYLGLLVTLCAPVPLHPLLACVQPHASGLLSALHVYNGSRQ